MTKEQDKFKSLAKQAAKDPKASIAFARRYMMAGFVGGILTNREKTVIMRDCGPESKK